MILLKTNDVYRAEEKFKEVLEIDNEFNQAKIALAECKLKQNKPYEAIEMLNNYDENLRDKKDYLFIRMLALNAILKIETENSQIRDEILLSVDNWLNLGSLPPRFVMIDFFSVNTLPAIPLSGFIF